MAGVLQSKRFATAEICRCWTRGNPTSISDRSKPWQPRSLLNDYGVELRDVYVGPEGVLTGSARLTKKVENEAALLLRDQEVEFRRIDRESKRTTLKAQITLLRTEFAEHELAPLKIIDQEKAEKAQLAQGREDMGLSRQVDAKPGKLKGVRNESEFSPAQTTEGQRGIKPLHLEMYVAGQSPKSIRAIANTKAICEENAAWPLRSRGERSVSAAATGVGKTHHRGADTDQKPSAPFTPVIGDMSNTERVLVRLDIRSKP